MEIPVQQRALLELEWLYKLLVDELGLAQQHGQGRSGQLETTYNFGDPRVLSVAARPSPEGFSYQISDSARTKDLERLALVARRRATANELGEGVVFKVSIRGAFDPLAGGGSLQLMRFLGEHRPLNVIVRLGGNVLLEISEPAGPDGSNLFTAFAADCFILAPGPISGPFSEPLARAQSDYVRVCLAFASGQPANLSPLLFPASEEEAASARTRLMDPALPSLARNGIALDALWMSSLPGGLEVFRKVRNAYVTYAAAIEQTHPEAALMLLVIAIEALTTPDQAWKQDRVVRRFSRALVDLADEELDAVLRRDDFRIAFGSVRGKSVDTRRRHAAEALYDLRSGSSHEGLGPGSLTFFEVGEPGIRIALASALAQAAILKFLQRPCDWLIGHPAIDPVSVGTDELTTAAPRSAIAWLI
jgi:hypothetical protein